MMFAYPSPHDAFQMPDDLFVWIRFEKIPFTKLYTL